LEAKQQTLEELLTVLAVMTLPFLSFIILMYLFQGFQSTPRLRNVEEVVWTDWRGRERRITIHRRVE